MGIDSGCAFCVKGQLIGELKTGAYLKGVVIGAHDGIFHVRLDTPPNIVETWSLPAG